MTPDMPWAADAACVGTDPELFFPDDHASKYDTRTVRQVCAGCDVRLQCLDYALTTGQEYGVWGGLTATQRRPLRRDRRAA